MKTTKTMKFSTMSIFIISALATFAIFLSACNEDPLESEISAVDTKTAILQASGTDLSIMANKFVVNVKNQGAVGDGVTDDTQAFQRAVDKAADTAAFYKTTAQVFVPKGTYLIDPLVSINMRSNVHLNMIDTQRVLLAKPNDSARYYVIKMKNISNAKIIGGKIIGDRFEHIVTDSCNMGEHGMGIGIYSCYNARVEGTHIINCWGDGITVGRRKNHGAINPSKNCVIDNVVCDNNRRQGLTIGTVDSLIVKNSTFTNTYGTDPMDGIDIEPDWGGTAQYVHITNCLIGKNCGNGIEMNAKKKPTNPYAYVKNITVEQCVIYENMHPFYLLNTENVEFIENTFKDNRYGGKAEESNYNTIFVGNDTIDTPAFYVKCEEKEKEKEKEDKCA